MDYLLTTSAIALIAALELIGHAALWVGVVNRLNAFALPHGLLRWVNRLCLVCCAVPPVILGGIALASALHVQALAPLAGSILGWTINVYLALCLIIGAWAIFVWLLRRLSPENSRLFIRANHTRHFDVARLRGENLSGNRKAAICSRIPGNQIFQFHTQTKQIVLPGLPSALDRFSIAHLSDLHLAGHIRREFYGEVIRQTNLLNADLVAVTGDIIDRPHCQAWLAETLGQLRARHGVYFILGNHDGRRCAPDEVRRTLVELGLIDLGGRAELLEHQGEKILLAGNELPWHKAPPPASELPATPMDPDVLSIALSHSPDQFAWAQRAGYKLMLAGHVHGGQICLPVVGPMLSPSRYGVRYAGGFFAGRPTLLHVTRGVSGMIPLRFNCPPEVAKLVLQRAHE